MTEVDSLSGWPTGRLLSTAARLVEHAWIDALERLGLTHAGLVVLHLLDDATLSQTELARSARVEVQTMSRTLERLERAGFIVRQKHPLDGRRHVVARSTAGKKVWRQARSLEAELFPASADNPELRAALLGIIASASSGRFS